jgi:hypothetical protein
LFNINNVAPEKRNRLYELLKQRELENVTPTMERFREPWRIKIAHGGRGGWS